MAKKTNELLRLFSAGVISFIAAYLTEPSHGALATVPFIIILPAAAYLLHGKALHIVGFCALGAFIFRSTFASEISEILIFTASCVLYSALAILAVKFAQIAKERKSKKLIIHTALIFVLSITLYFIFHGTFFANLSSKELNENYISSTYPNQSFTVGSTVYSFEDKCYLTEAVFTDKEVYKAYFSANKDGSAKHDGYRDYCEARLMESGTNALLSYLSNYAHEGEDFALRRNRIATDELLSPTAAPSDYYDKMCYDIAFYDAFTEQEKFSEKCREYVSYIPESFDYKEITFYGLGENGSFRYSLTVGKDSPDFTVVPFDKDSFSVYNNDKDTHKYWSIIK